MFALGCRKDPKDLRDIPMGLVLPPIPLPKSLDYALEMSPVRNQGNEGTCIAFADGQPDEDGTYPRIAMKVLAKYGVAEESCWPYKPFQKDFPCADANKEAKRYRIKAYARLYSVVEMRRSLAINGPFLAGVRVFKSWFSKRVIKSGIIPMPRKNEKAVGGHAVCIAGFDDAKQIFKFKNSWGRSWADKGYGYFSYAYMQQYCVDAWSATDLILNPKALVKKREEVINKFN